MKQVSDCGRANIGARMALIGSLVAGVMAFSAATQAATIIPGAGPPVINGDNNLSIGDVFTVEVIGNTGDGADSFFLGFTALQDLFAVETNTFNPLNGFENPFLEWRENSDGTGTQFASLSSAELTAGFSTMVVSFLAGETKYLIASWDDINVIAANWDLRIEAAPIPLPAGLILLLTGLGGVGFLGRYSSRRNRPAAA